MKLFTDQTGRTVFLEKSPRRIISLVPSQTELLFDLGLDEEVVGITKFCIHPPLWFYSKTRVGGTKQLHLNRIHEMQPDLIIANKEENVKEQVEELAEHYPVWISDINNLDGAYHMIGQLGELTGRAEKAADLINSIRNNFEKLSLNNKKPSAAYFIWNDPYMVTGGDTFIHAMLEAAGFDNVFSHRSRYPEITIDDIKTKKPEILLLSSEPFPFKQKHVEQLREACDTIGLNEIKIVLVDGEMFSWYGSRLQYAPQYFSGLIARLSTGN